MNKGSNNRRVPRHVLLALRAAEVSKALRNHEQVQRRQHRVNVSRRVFDDSGLLADSLKDLPNKKLRNRENDVDTSAQEDLTV